MNEKETIQFYDDESAKYSLKRYTKRPESYYQYLFTRRLSIFLSLLEKIEPSLPNGATLLEIGCADGVVMKAIEKKFPGRFSSLVGTDISPNMIEEAKRTNKNSQASFVLRHELPVRTYDVVVELGVLVPDINQELEDAAKNLSAGGYFFYCLPGRNSLHALFKSSTTSSTENFSTYMDNDKFITSKFNIECSRVYALFVPKIWAFPIAGRLLQPVFDFLFQKITPELFHEKIYLLQNKTKQ